MNMRQGLYVSPPSFGFATSRRTKVLGVIDSALFGKLDENIA